MKNIHIKKILYIIAGWFLVSIGIIGIFVPLLPTTIFFILAASCFARSSEKFYNWLIYHRLFGKIIRDYKENRGMSARSKVIAIFVLLLGIGSSAVFFTNKTLIRILLAAIAIGVAVHILSLKTIRKSQTILED
jgi:uncharacterized protein